jgi:hypothetical protein
VESKPVWRRLNRTSEPLDDVEKDARKLIACVGELLKDIPQFGLSISAVAIGERSCTLQFVPRDDRLARVRDTLQQRFASSTFASEPRYTRYSPHITFVRYLQRLQSTLTAWKQSIEGELTHRPADWTVSQLWLTWGATWFGMQSRITQRGPYDLR